MNFYLYKTINKVNNHYYLGRRQTNMSPAEDPYLGSGIRLKAAIKKYGKENFVKEIIAVYETYSDLVRAEKELITEQVLNDTHCYNLALGGDGGFTFYEERVFRHTEESKQKISKANKGRKRPDVSKRYKETLSKYWIGKKRSYTDRIKKSEAAKKNIEAGRHAGTTILTCPHCGKKTNTGNAKRWHFNNCKQMKERL